MKEIVKTYKSKKSHQNQVTFMRSHFNQVRLDKTTTKFKKVQTSGSKNPKNNFNSIIDECRAYKDYEYICSGLNSTEREILIIDCDDEDFGIKTLDLMAKDGLVPHYQKVKSNGHSQTGLFIKPVKISYVSYSDGALKEVDNEETHLMFKRTYQMLNLLYNGDICYTGYNCQNPLYKNANIKSFKNYKDAYSLKDIYDFCLSKITTDNIEYFLKNKRVEALLNKPKGIKQDKSFKIIYKYLDEQANNNQSLQSIITNVTVLEDVIDAISCISDSFNKDIFVTSTRTCRNFLNAGKLTEENKDIVKKAVYRELQRQYNVSDVASYIDYSQDELIKRINDDVNQIYQKNFLGRMEWNKVGYTKEQREMSAKTRGLSSLVKQQRVATIYNENNDLSLREIAKIYEERFNEKISYKTVQRLIKKEEERLSNQSLPVIITNVTDYSKYNDLNNFYKNTLINQGIVKEEEQKTEKDYSLEHLAEIALALQSQ